MPEFTRVTSVTTTHTTTTTDWETVTALDGAPILYARGIEFLNDEAAAFQRRYGTSGGAATIPATQPRWSEPIPVGCELILNASSKLQVKAASGIDITIVAHLRG